MNLQFEKLNVPSAYQVLSRELRRMIVRGALKAGDQLPTESQLAEPFGVNRARVFGNSRTRDSFVVRAANAYALPCPTNAT